jgi:MFS family permease
MSIGTIGYSIYVGSLWSFQLHNTRWFVIFAGAMLGVSAALFWAAQGSIMMSYPREKDKGRSFTVFWVLFQMGTLIGAAIALGIQFHSSLPGVSTAVYVTFVIIMLTAIGTSWLVLPPQAVVRGDGTLVELQSHISPREEFRAFTGMFRDWRMLALFPMFFSSNFFYAYQGAITAYLFNGRTRALVSLLTGLGSLMGAILIGFLTDNLPFGRRKRALISCGVVFLMVCGIWGGGLAFQLKFKRGDTLVSGAEIPWDWTVGASTGPIILLLACKYRN